MPHKALNSDLPAPKQDAGIPEPQHVAHTPCLSLIIPLAHTDQGGGAVTPQALHASLSSILHQVPPPEGPVEILLAGSNALTPDSCHHSCQSEQILELCEDYVSRLPDQVRLFAGSTKPWSACNQALTAARAPYACFVLPGDTLGQDFCAALLGTIRGCRADIIESTLGWCNAHGRCFKRPPSPQADALQSCLCRYGRFYTAIYSTAFLARHALRFPEDLGFWAEQLFLYQVLIRCSMFTCSPAAVYICTRTKPPRSALELDSLQITSALQACQRISSLFLSRRGSHSLPALACAYQALLSRIYQELFCWAARPADEQRCQTLVQALWASCPCRKAVGDLIQEHAASFDMKQRAVEHFFATPAQRPGLLAELCTQFRSRPVNLRNPQGYFEKLQWFKLYGITELHSKLADKYAVRPWVADRIGEQHLIPMLGVYDRPEDIDFEKLPRTFVIKCTHGSGLNTIVNDKHALNYQKLRAKLSFQLRLIHGMAWFERQYWDIAPRIIIEEKLESHPGEGLDNYRIWTFDGRPTYIQWQSDPSLPEEQVQCAFYSTDWEYLGFGCRGPGSRARAPQGSVASRPAGLSQMLTMARTLAQGLNFVRVDLYYMPDGRIYFGEMTFTPAGGFTQWLGRDMDQEIGDLIPMWPDAAAQ